MKKRVNYIGFWVLSLTWGLPMTLFGAIVAIGCLVTVHKPHKFHQNVYFVFGHGGWGFEAGGFFFLSKECADNLSMKQHESGHGLQNIVYGVFMPFLVSIPSAVRFWHRDWLVKTKRKKYSELPPYDSIWFEGQATAWGEKHYSATLR